MAESPKTASVPFTLNRTPKQRFHDHPEWLSQHNQFVVSPIFERGSDFALLQYQAYLSSQSVDGQNAAANHFKMVGAIEFLQTFRLLAEKPMMPTVVDRDNLPQS